MRCPNLRCPIVTVCKAAEDDIPAMCYYRDSMDLLGDPETRQLMSNPGHCDREEYYALDSDNCLDAGDDFNHRRA
jgi:hypothetical protein